MRSDSSQATCDQLLPVGQLVLLEAWEQIRLVHLVSVELDGRERRYLKDGETIPFEVAEEAFRDVHVLERAQSASADVGLGAGLLQNP